MLQMSTTTLYGHLAPSRLWSVPSAEDGSYVGSRSVLAAHRLYICSAILEAWEDLQ
jgi:hypothetical protein